MRDQRSRALPVRTMLSGTGELNVIKVEPEPKSHVVSRDRALGQQLKNASLFTLMARCVTLKVSLS